VNEAEVRAVPIYGGFTAQFRKIHRSGWHDVKINGEVQTYDTAEQAEVAAYKALMRHLFGDGIVRDGETASATRTKAEAIFRKGRKIAVERR
jgi:hypothetical protein